jgi:hypothetical protein
MDSFNADFCEKLDAYLMKAMQHSTDPLAQGCWMDGVLMPFIERQTSKKHVNDVRRLETHAWALTDHGCIKLDLIVYFGKYSLRRYAKGSPLDDCLPASDNPDAIKIDFDKKIIEVRLL